MKKTCDQTLNTQLWGNEKVFGHLDDLFPAWIGLTCIHGSQYFIPLFGLAPTFTKTNRRKYKAMNYAFLHLSLFDSDKGWHAISAASFESIWTRGWDGLTGHRFGHNLCQLACEGGLLFPYRETTQPKLSEKKLNLSSMDFNEGHALTFTSTCQISK